MAPLHSKFDYSTVVDDLLQKLTSPLIRRVRLACGARINEWLCHVFTWKVEEIQLATYPPEVLDLPVLYTPILFSTQSLVTLELGSFSYHLPDDVAINLPNLKKLVLTLLTSDRKFIEKLIRYCPSLEELFFEEEVNSWGAPNGTTINISGQNLRRLTLRLWSSIGVGSVEVYAPKLRYFVLYASWMQCCFVNEKPMALLQAEVSLLYHPQSHGTGLVLQLFKTISGVTSLRLDSSALCALFRLVDKGELKPFLNLTRLTVFRQCPAYCRKLLDLLKFSPVLEVLVLDMACYSGGEQISWNPRDCSAPACFLAHVRRIEIKMRIPVKDKYVEELIPYMLRNAKVLEIFSVEVPDPPKFKLRDPEGQLCEVEFYKKLYHWPRSSSDCHIEFLGTHLSVSNKATKAREYTYLI